ncbi:unnamed protein product [Pleuronectes platessa]|uniref:Actin-related protein 2/3 complex subunit 5 n=1 Tax=Pleuronectes platessa TaxID=8262 RepID=A0A9N7VBJ0_PLEPL|nr:unnamed protein product [Pleuronectes platessa]
MSKSSLSDRFRKVDVDEYDENKFVDEEEGGENQGGPDESEVDVTGTALLAWCSELAALRRPSGHWATPVY